MKIPLAAAILTLTTALAGPSAWAGDARIASRLYDPSTIVPVVGRPGFETTILFAEGERIENVAVGDSAGWQVTPNRRANLLFLKPIQPQSHTNMTVVTDQRTYMFDLVTGRRGALYALRFTYPDPPPKPVVTAGAPPAEKPVAAPPARPGLPLATMNFAWKGEGAEGLLPARVFDDGKSVYLRWDGDAEVPAILVADREGMEGPVNFFLRQGYVVVDGVPGQIILKSGKRRATLTNEAPARAPTPMVPPVAAAVPTPVPTPAALLAPAGAPTTPPAAR